MNPKQKLVMMRNSMALKKKHPGVGIKMSGFAKYCKGCHIKGKVPFGISNISNFRVSKGSVDGLRNTCKTCESEKVNLTVLARLVQEQDDAGIKPSGNTVMVYCPTCERWLPILQFSRRSTGVGSSCRGCYVLSRYEEEIVDSIINTRAGFKMAINAVRDSIVDDSDCQRTKGHSAPPKGVCVDDLGDIDYISGDRRSHELPNRDYINEIKISDFTADDIDIEPEPTEYKVKRVLLFLGISVLTYLIFR